MVEGDYSIQIRILEANDLVPTYWMIITSNSGFSIFKSKGSAVNAFVQATVGNQSRRTKVNMALNLGRQRLNQSNL